MRRAGLISVYLLVMAAVGFVVAPRIAGQGRPHGAATPVIAALTPATPPASTPALVLVPSLALPPTETPAPTAVPLEASPYAPNRLIIPALGINSAWSGLGFLADGLTMDSPAGPMDLGWYTFTGAPGGPSNAVFAGHVDWYTGAHALFAGLSSLGVGDEVQVSRADGKLVVYHVVSSTWYNFLKTDASSIIAPSSQPTVTLITCGGTFDQATHEYDMRLVVRAIATN
jgi:sortase (surface protein transpeptidase)